jgi:hypothetical protein
MSKKLPKVPFKLKKIDIADLPAKSVVVLSDLNTTNVYIKGDQVHQPWLASRPRYFTFYRLNTDDHSMPWHGSPDNAPSWIIETSRMAREGIVTYVHDR